MAETETEETLFDKIVDALSLEREEDESAEDYKIRAVRHAGDMEDEDFEALPDDVKTWLNAATEVVKKNRGARKTAPLPALEGLEGDDEEEASKKGRKARAAKEPKAPREKKVREPRPERDPTDNRIYKFAELMILNPKWTAEDLAKKAVELEYEPKPAVRLHGFITNVFAALKKHGKLAA